MNGAFDVSCELVGWELSWVELELTSDDTSALAELSLEIFAQARAEHGEALSPELPEVAAMRRLFRAAGCDPTRYRPSSEALLRRVLKGEDLAPIHPFVDLNNLLSISLIVPCCVMAEGTIRPPYTLRAGTSGEEYLSLRGPFSLEGKPLLADPEGPFGTPITDSERVRVHPDTRRAILVAYLPTGEVSAEACERKLAELVVRSGCVKMRRVSQEMPQEI